MVRASWISLFCIYTRILVSPRGQNIRKYVEGHIVGRKERMPDPLLEPYQLNGAIYILGSGTNLGWSLAGGESSDLRGVLSVKCKVWTALSLLTVSGVTLFTEWLCCLCRFSFCCSIWRVTPGKQWRDSLFRIWSYLLIRHHIPGVRRIFRYIALKKKRYQTTWARVVSCSDEVYPYNLTMWFKF